MNISLKDPAADHLLKTRGYVILPLLSPEEQDELSAYSVRINPPFPRDRMFYSNMQHHDRDYVEDTRHFLTQFLWPKVNALLNNAEPIEGVFINKPPGMGVFSNHQDWSIVDEARVRTYCAWVPLHDVDEHNGGFGVLEGSHQFFKGFRSATTPWQYSGDEFGEVIDRHRTMLRVRKGEALFFDNALIHATMANDSDRDRTVTMIGMKPKGEVMLHHYQTEVENEVEVFEIDVNFFTTYDYKSRPSGYRSLGTAKNDVIDLSPTQLEEAVVRFKQQFQ